MEKAKKTARNWYHQAANDADRIFVLLLYPVLLLPVLAGLFSLQKKKRPIGGLASISFSAGWALAIPVVVLLGNPGLACSIE